AQQEVGPAALECGAARNALAGSIDGKDALVAVGGIFVLLVVIKASAGFEGVLPPHFGQSREHAVISVEIAVRSRGTKSSGIASGCTKGDAGNPAQGAGEQQRHLDVRRTRGRGQAS